MEVLCLVLSWCGVSTVLLEFPSKWQTSLMGMLSMCFIPVFILLSSCLLHEILFPPDPLVRSVSKRRVRLGSGKCMWAPSSLHHVAEGGDYAAGGLGWSADKHFKFYVLNMYLKTYWFSIYGGNTKLPFKIIFPFLNWNIHIPKAMLLKFAIQWFLVCSLCCATATSIHFQNVFIIPNRSSVPIKQ